MYVFKTSTDLQNYIKRNTLTIGFVPTMGALHGGHLSLIKTSKAENDLTICSIFVNPTQFNDKKDFEKYPMTIEEDIKKLSLAGTDILFLPEVSEIYPSGTEQIRQYDIGYLDTVLDGKFRPGHFNGVSNVVHILLNAVTPNKMYLGEKDFQQCLVIKQLVRFEELKVEVIVCPTLRNEDGLAQSSRNERLSENARRIAPIIYQCLCHIKHNMHEKSFTALQAECLSKLSSNGFETEYLLLANADNLHMLDEFDFSLQMVVLVASKLDGVRLIDNLLLS